MSRAKVYLLLLLLFIDAASVAALYLRHIGVSTRPSVSTASTCIWRAYVIEYPEGLGPWNTVLVAENTSTHVYYPVVLLPWPLHKLRLWSSPLSSWEAYRLALTEPQLYAATKHPAPVKKTVYTWRRTRTWLAILPCKGQGYSREELGNFTTLARSEPVKGVVFIAALWKGVTQPINPVLLPLSTGWIHVLVYGYYGCIYRSRRIISALKFAGLVELHVTGMLLDKLSRAVAGIVRLHRVNITAINITEAPAHKVSIYRESFLGSFLVTHFGPDIGMVGFSGDIYRIFGFYVFSDKMRTRISIGETLSSSNETITVAQFEAAGHLDVVVSVLPAVRPATTSLDFTTDTPHGAIYSYPLGFVHLTTEKPLSDCNTISSYETIFLANTVHVKSPGVEIPVYVSAPRLMSIGPRNALLIEARVSTKTSIEILIDGLPVCRGIGGCNATIKYPWIYPLMLEPVISGEPLEVAILSNKTITLTSLELIYGLCSPERSMSSPRYVLIEPVDPRTLAPMGIVAIKIDAPRNKIRIEGEAVGAFTMTLRGALIDLNKSTLETYILPPKRGWFSAADKVLQPHINWIDDWEPFLSMLNYALGNPMVVLTRNSVSFIYNKAYGDMTIAYKPESTEAVAVITHRVPGAHNPIRITLRLR